MGTIEETSEEDLFEWLDDEVEEGIVEGVVEGVVEVIEEFIETVLEESTGIIDDYKDEADSNVGDENGEFSIVDLVEEVIVEVTETVFGSVTSIEVTVETAQEVAVVETIETTQELDDVVEGEITMEDIVEELEEVVEIIGTYEEAEGVSVKVENEINEGLLREVAPIEGDGTGETNEWNLCRINCNSFAFNLSINALSIFIWFYRSILFDWDNFRLRSCWWAAGGSQNRPGRNRGSRRTCNCCGWRWFRFRREEEEEAEAIQEYEADIAEEVDVEAEAVEDVEIAEGEKKLMMMKT